MPESSKRLSYLQSLVSKGGDPFVWYGLAMEYRSLDRCDEALVTFQKLREQTPDYVPAYLMCGQMLTTMGRMPEAREWLRAGLEVARKVGNAHAASELEAALESL